MFDEYQYREIYDREVNRIYRVCKMYLQNHSDACDAVQEVFVRLFRCEVMFKDSSHIQAWLIRTAKNYCVDVLKSSWNKKRVDIDDMEAVIQAQQGVENTTLNEKVKSLVLSLPIKQKEVLYLYYYEEYAIREISQMLKVKESTIQSRLAAGRKLLKEKYEELMGGEES